MMEAGRATVYGLQNASTILNPRTVGIINEDYDSAAQRVQTSLNYVMRHDPAVLDPSVIPLAQELLDLRGGEQNLWDSAHDRLESLDAEREGRVASRRALGELLRELDALVAEVTN